jgi:hemoglobin
MTRRRSNFLRILAAAAVLALSTAPFAAEERLFFRMGGEAKLRAVVDELVDVLLEDERINFAFAQADLPRFKQLLYAQLCELAAGPCIYDGRDMRAAHAKLPLTNAHFNALTEDLYIAFDRVGIAYPLQNEMVALLAPMQRDIVRK